MQLPPVRYVPDSRAPCMSPLFASVHSYTALIWQYQTVDTECATRACAQQSQKAREKVGSTPVAVLGRNGVKCPASSGSAGRSAKFPGMPGMWCCNAVLLYWHQMSKHRVGLQAELRQPQSAGAGHWKEAGRGGANQSCCAFPPPPTPKLKSRHSGGWSCRWPENTTGEGGERPREPSHIDVVMESGRFERVRELGRMPRQSEGGVGSDRPQKEREKLDGDEQNFENNTASQCSNSGSALRREDMLDEINRSFGAAMRMGCGCIGAAPHFEVKV